MPQEIHPENVKWRYFYCDENGHVKSIDDENELPKIEKVAMLTTSFYYSGSDKNTTPARMKSIAYDNEVKRIKAVEKLFAILVIFGGEERAGHAVSGVVQAQLADSLKIDKSGKITEIAIVRSADPVEKLSQKFDVRKIIPTNWSKAGDIFADSDKEESVPRIGEAAGQFQNYPYQKNPALAESSKIDHEISQTKLLPGNQVAEDFLTSDASVKVIGGTQGNLAERSLAELKNKGSICFIPARWMSNIDMLINARKLGPSKITSDVPNVPLIIFSIDNPTDNAPRVMKTIEDFGIKTPIFFTTQPLNTKVPALFLANIDLQKMLAPDFVTLSADASALKSQVRTQ